MSDRQTEPERVEWSKLRPEERDRVWRIDTLREVCDGDEEAAQMLNAGVYGVHDIARARARGATVAQLLRIFT